MHRFVPFQKGFDLGRPQGNIRQPGHILRGEYMQAFFASVLQMALRQLPLVASAQLALEVELALRQEQELEPVQEQWVPLPLK